MKKESWFLREYSWTKWTFTLFGVIFLVFGIYLLLVLQEINVFTAVIIFNSFFTLAMLAFVLVYLSDIRYKLFFKGKKK